MFTEREWNYIKTSDQYKTYADVKLSEITVTELVTDIKKITVLEPVNLLVARYLYELLDIIRRDASGSNPVFALDSDMMANIIRAGGDPYTDYTIKAIVPKTGNLSAGGEVSAAQIVAAVSGKKIVPVHLEIFVITAAGIGVDGSAIIKIQDDAGTPVVGARALISVGAPHVDLHIFKPMTVSKDLDFAVTAGPTHMGAGKYNINCTYVEV